MAELSWEYIAGFFDGEGAAGIVREGSKSGARFYATMSQTGDVGKALLCEIANKLKREGIVTCLLLDRHPGNVIGFVRRKQIHRLNISHRKNTIPFLRALLPYLRIKKSNVQDMLRYNRIFPARSGRLRGGYANRAA
jgi:hypothetical protein